MESRWAPFGVALGPICPLFEGDFAAALCGEMGRADASWG
jgi:hypothetical protein